MSSLLRNPVAKRLLRPAAALVDQRVQRPVNRLRKELDSLRREVHELRGNEYAVSLLFDRTGRSGPRLPTPAQIDRLVAEVAQVSGADQAAARRNVTIAFRNVIALEALAVGRLAGSTQNVCGKLATVPLLSPPNAQVLEIGTLYGLFSATLLRMLHRAGIEPELTIVDPLAGSQLQPGGLEGLDPTGTPVRVDVVRANLALGGKAGERARVEVGFSGDPEVRSAVSDRQYGVIVVDGDHSARGVTEDLEWAEEIAAPGAVVVLDDYGDRKWAGVQQGADAYLAGATRFELIGRVSTSAFLRAR
ncbi:class I SAM-dependent methyltransferase [Actinacidiphila guanduensis]|uniref:Methyltransferase domain-containing protein n=1 Tax=Actinacidiphila guanduensis TaxID=310781 RepID=A0A1G9ZS76_9ACTN|nr:class I SAM-dependent methyltransferase [Actinacidiphila guanduensis]SDN23975.1 Methyltransferase domain-containing protein [Actinacidiphila guanduensis]